MNQVTKKFLPSILSVAVASTLATSAALSQGMLLEEVVVTAQKREENLQDTALAITAFTSDSLDQLNITTAEDYEALVPSLSYRGTPERLSIRGVGRVSNSLGLDPGIAIYRDGIYNSEAGILSRANSLTTARVEVLRGPQGTLFGRNATGGAISVTSKRPTEEFEHHVRAKVGNYNQLGYGASSSGPISDTVGYRVWGQQTSRDGYIENVGGGDLWDNDAWSAGAQISWDATEDLNIWVQYHSEARDHQSGAGYGLDGHLITPYDTSLRDTNPLIISPAYQWTKENPTASDPYKVDYDTLGTVETNATDNFTAHVTYELDNLTVKYIGSYYELDSSGGGSDRDFTSNPNNSLLVGGETNATSQSHELQLISSSDGMFQWVAGLYYFEDDRQQPYYITNPTNENLDQILPGFGVAYDPNIVTLNPDRVIYSQFGDLESTSQAVYLDTNYKFNEQFKLTVGVRYSEDEKTGYENQPTTYGDSERYFVSFAEENCCGINFNEPVTEANHQDSWSDTSGRIVLDYTPDDDQLIYGSISTGYKSGGFRLGSLQEETTFDPEEIVSFEIGYKATFNERFLINAAVYHYDYSDMQVLGTFINQGGLAQEEVINADKAEIDGVEIETTWVATDNLRFMLSYSYIDGEYTDFCCVIDTVSNPGVEQDLSGSELVQAPKNKASLNGNYTWFTDNMGEFSISGNYSYVDERQYSIFANPESIADAYYRSDLLMTWYSPSGALRVLLAGKNITDEQSWTSLSIDSPSAVIGMPNEPRTYSLEVQYDF
jgi:iron complex outermembrane receptor protein